MDASAGDRNSTLRVVKVDFSVEVICELGPKAEQEPGVPRGARNRHSLMERDRPVQRPGGRTEASLPGTGPGEVRAGRLQSGLCGSSGPPS